MTYRQKDGTEVSPSYGDLSKLDANEQEAFQEYYDRVFIMDRWMMEHEEHDDDSAINELYAVLERVRNGAETLLDAESDLDADILELEAEIHKYADAPIPL